LLFRQRLGDNGSDVLMVHGVHRLLVPGVPAP
jgi:hypothetical protein